MSQTQTPRTTSGSGDDGDIRRFYELLHAFYHGVDVADRKYRLRTYKAVFVGSEAVDWLVESPYAETRAQAVHVGQILLEAGVFEHVKADHGFKDEYLFYTFTGGLLGLDGMSLSDAELLDDAAATPSAVSSSFLDALGSDGRLADDGSDAAAASDGPAALPPLMTIQGITLERTLSAVEGLFGAAAPQSIADLHLAPNDEANAALVANCHPLDWDSPTEDIDQRYNFVVIGGGTAGLVTAIGSAGFEARVAIIEEHLTGGDCLVTGCVPSKSLIAAGHAVYRARNTAPYGVTVAGDVDVDFARIMERMREIRADISHDDSAHRLRDAGVDVFFGRGKFIDAKSIEVNGNVLRFKRACIATGGRAGIPAIPGLADAAPLTNASVFNLTELPARLLVLGTGPVGCELAQTFARFGSRVIMTGRSDNIMRNEDPEAATIVRDQLLAEGVDLRLGIEYVRVDVADDGSKVVVIREPGSSDEVALAVDHILVAAGRRPNVEGLNLEAAGIEYSTKHGILVNDSLRTSNSAVYACGDVASSLQFTHMADAMARIVIRNALFFGSAKVTDLIVPWSTYTYPEVAHVGLYERDLIRAGADYTVWKRELAHNDRAQAEGETSGFVKAFTNSKGHILGATIVSDKAGELISSFTIAMTQGITLGELGNIIQPYPTQAFEIKRLGDDYNRTRLTPKVMRLLKTIVKYRR